MKRITSLLIIILMVFLSLNALAVKNIRIKPELKLETSPQIRESINKELFIPNEEIRKSIYEYLEKHKALPDKPPSAEQIKPGGQWMDVVAAGDGMPVAIYEQPDTSSPIITYIEDTYWIDYYMALSEDYRTGWGIAYNAAWTKTNGFGYVQMKNIYIPGIDG